MPSGFPVAFLSAPFDGAEAAVLDAVTLGRRPAALQDPEYSSGNWSRSRSGALTRHQRPFTAGSVVDHLGDALCRIAPRHLPTGVVLRDGQAVLVHPVTDYDGLCDAMFHMIRQNAAGSVHVLGRMLDVLARVAEVERRPDRAAELSRHAGLVIAAARRDVADPSDLADLEDRYRRFRDIASDG